MSTLIGLKINDVAVLATDSILYDNQDRIMSTSQEKIFEVAPGLFYGWSGPRALAIDQARIAAELSQTRTPENLYAFADALNVASKPALERPRILSEEQAAGEVPFFIYILAGMSEGSPGFLVCVFTLKNGEVVRQMAGDFRPTTNGEIIRYITGESVEEMLKDPETWVGGPIPAADRFVEYQRKVMPKYAGGPTQMACVDGSGARWVRRLTEEGIGGVKAALADGLTFASGKIAPNLGGGVHINPVTKQLEVDNVEIGAFASSVRPIALFTSDPALPDAKYPVGTYGFNVTTKIFKRVNDAGNAWVLAVHGGKDIQAGTITATQIDTPSLNAAVASLGYATVSYLSANYANLTTLASTYATIDNLNAKTFTADKIVGGTCTATVSFTSPSISSTLNGVIAEMNGVYDSSVGGNAGLRVRSSGAPNYRVVVVPGGIWLIDASNVVRAQVFGDGTAKFYRSSGALSVSIDGANGQILMYDASGVNRLWMDTFSNAGHIGVTGTGASVTVNGVPLT